MTPGVRAVLAGLASGSRVLDAACGVGIDAAALSRRGFDVVAADESAAMIEATTRRLADTDATAAVVRSRWTELPERLEPASFDALLCVGNSIAHVRDDAEMVETLRAFAAMLAPGGIAVVDTHHWSMLAQLGDVVVEDRVLERGPERARRRYRWRWSEEPWTCRIDFELDIERANAVDHRTHAVVLHPFTTTDLRRNLRAAGFVDVGLDARPDDDRYTAVGRAPADATVTLPSR